MLKSVLSLFSRNSSLQKRSAEELQDLRQKWKNLYAVNLLGIERTLKIALGSIAVASAGIISLFSGTTPFYFLYFAIGAGYLGVGAGKLVSAGIGKYGRGREGQIYEHFKTNLKSEWTAKEEGKKRTTHERRRKFFHAARHQKSITPVQPLPPLRIGKKDP